MDEKLILSSAGLAAIVAGVGLYFQYGEIEDSRLQVETVKAKILEREDSVNGLKASLQAVRASAAIQTKAMEQMVSCQTGQARLDALKAERRRTVGEFVQTVGRVRQQAGQVVVPELALKDGSRLINAKLRKVDQTGVAFLHEGGVTLVNDKLTDDMRARFRPDVDALSASIMAAERPASGAPGARPGAVPTAPGALPRMVGNTLQQRVAALPPGIEILEFYADWCGPCRSIKSQVEQFATEISPKVRLARINFDSDKQMVGRFGIKVIPTFVVLKGGQEVTRRVGAISIESMRAMIGL